MMSKDPLIAVMIRPINRMLKEGLTTVTIFPIKKMSKNTIVNRFRSIFPVTINKMGAATAKMKEKIVINSPACPRLTCKSVAIKSNIPPMMSSTIPTINDTIIKKYTRLSMVKRLSSKLTHLIVTPIKKKYKKETVDRTVFVDHLPDSAVCTENIGYYSCKIKSNRNEINLKMSSVKKKTIFFVILRIDLTRLRRKNMSDAKLNKEAMHMLKKTSRTFYIPIKLLKKPLRKTVGSAYLCMRAIDEVEDHEQLDAETKQHLLRSTSELLKKEFAEEAYRRLVQPYEADLPEVTLRLADWIAFCPSEIVDKVKESTSIMANGMADWVEKDWQIETKEDLDNYTYYVAGLVGVMLSDIWSWYDQTETDRDLAIGYGRGLQAVNVLRNQDEDAVRGVRFFPNNWTRDDMYTYATENLKKADEYIKDINNRNILLFCKIPLALAKKTMKAMRSGKEKMSRNEVEETVDEIMKES